MARTLAQRAAVFVGVYVACTAIYISLKETLVQSVLIETLTVRPAAWFLQLFASDTGAVARGSRLTSPGGGINVLSGCEGTDVLFLVVAALLAAPLSWRNRLLGLVFGALLTFGANQVRIIGLFFAARSHTEHFAILHGLIAPLAIVFVVGAWFWWFTRRFGGDAPIPMYRL